MLQRVEDFLEIASAGSSQDVVIVVDRMGGMRMLDPTGWTHAGLTAEFGAAEIYKVERRGGTVRVEGWSGSERCLVQRKHAPSTLADLPGLPFVSHPMMLQVAALPMG